MRFSNPGHFKRIVANQPKSTGIEHFDRGNRGSFLFLNQYKHIISMKSGLRFFIRVISKRYQRQIINYNIILQRYIIYIVRSNLSC